MREEIKNNGNQNNVQKLYICFTKLKGGRGGAGIMLLVKYPMEHSGVISVIQNKHDLIIAADPTTSLS